MSIIIQTYSNLSDASIKEIKALSIQYSPIFDTLFGTLLQVGNDSITIRAIDPNSLEKGSVSQGQTHL